jgi:hypothetical protein
MKHRITSVVAVLAAGTLALAGCTSDSTDTSSGSDTTAATAAAEPAATAAPSAPAGAPNSAQFEQARQCLEAAGIDLPELPSGVPSLQPGQTPPPGFTPPAGGGDASALFNNPQVSAALKACGIELPTAPSQP